MGGTVSKIFQGSPMTAGGAPTSVPGMIGAVPNGTNRPTSAGKIFKSALTGGADKFASETQQQPIGGGGAVLSPGAGPTPVDPGYFAPSNFGGSPFDSRRSPIYGGM